MTGFLTLLPPNYRNTFVFRHLMYTSRQAWLVRYPVDIIITIVQMSEGQCHTNANVYDRNSVINNFIALIIGLILCAGVDKKTYYLHQNQGN